MKEFIATLILLCLAACTSVPSAPWITVEFFEWDDVWRARIQANGNVMVDVSNIRRPEEADWTLWRTTKLERESLRALRTAVVESRFFELRADYSSGYKAPYPGRPHGSYKRATADGAAAIVRVVEGSQCHSVSVYQPRRIRRSGPDKPPHPDRADGDRFLRLWDAILGAVPRPPPDVSN